MHNHLPNDVCTMCTAYLAWNFQKNSWKYSNLGFHFAKHVPKSILASCKAHDGVMVHHIVTTKQHLDQPESFIHYSQTPISTIVWLNLPKFITNRKLLKIFLNLHLWYLYVKYCPCKFINVNKKSFSSNPLSYSWGTMWVDNDPQPQLATCGPFIHLASFR